MLRQSFYSIALIFFAAAVVFASPAAAQRVTVDTSPIARNNPSQLPAVIRAELAARLTAKLRGKYSGPVTVRIRSLQLASAGAPFRIDPTDYLEGDVIIPGRAPKPILLALPIDRSPVSYSPSGEARRVYFLVEYFADWAAKEF